MSNEKFTLELPTLLITMLVKSTSWLPLTALVILPLAKLADVNVNLRVSTNGPMTGVLKKPALPLLKSSVPKLMAKLLALPSARVDAAAN